MTDHEENNVSVETDDTAPIIASSITMKLLGSKAAAKLLAQDESVREMYFGFVYGAASSTGTSERETDKGEVVTDEFLRGDFGLDTYDGKRYQSGKCYLPEAVQGLISSSLYDDDGKAIRGAKLTFGFEIWAKRDTNKAGFTWQFKPLMKQSQKSPIELLRAKLLPLSHGHKPALPAPKRPNRRVAEPDAKEASLIADAN